MIKTELFSILYGEYIKELIYINKDNYNNLNYELKKWGKDIGIRIIDDIDNSENFRKIKDFKNLTQELCFVILKIYFGIDIKWNKELTTDKKIYLTMNKNFLLKFLILPEKYKDINYSNLLNGIIEGVFESLFYKVECTLKYKIKTEDNLKEKNKTELVVEFIDKIIKKLIDYEGD